MTVNSNGIAELPYLPNFALERRIRNNVTERFKHSISNKTIKLSWKVMIFFKVPEAEGMAIKIIQKRIPSICR